MIVRAGEAEELRGGGAGTFRLAWERDRPAPPAHVVDGHSLYYEVRAELGWVGIAPAAGRLRGPDRGGVGRLWGPGRHSHAAFLAAGSALLLHAMVDWDWEMPALFIWFFGAAGAISPRRRRRAATRERRGGSRASRRARDPAARGDAADGALSQSRLNRATDALRAGDCATATDAALDSIDALSAQAGAFEILGWCDARAGQQKLAVAAMRNAQRRDPRRLALRLRPRGDAGAGGAGPAPGRSPGAAAQPARAVRDHAGTAAELQQPGAPARGGGALADPLRLRLTTRGGPKPASREFAAVVLSARRRCDGAGPGRRSAARCRRGGPGWPRSR